jgi:putative transposase
MKGTRHSEEQVIAILKHGEAGLATSELCRQHGIADNEPSVSKALHHRSPS